MGVRVITFEIIGLPTPQGSKTRFPNGAMVEGATKGQRERHRSWRDSVTAAARDAADTLNDGPLDGPLMLEVVFRFPMPKARKKAVREAGICPKTSAPDLDKLVRSLGDGLEAGGLIRSDALICVTRSSKVEVVGWTGAVVTIGGAG